MIFVLTPKDKYTRRVSLQKKFEAVGIMAGMTIEEVVSKVGNPTSTFQLGAGKILCWSETGFDISIYFDELGVFSAITDKTIQHNN